MITSLEDFDRENARERARLEKELAIAHALPTNGVIVKWVGEGGWEPDGNTRKPDIERTIDVAPWIVHASFRGTERVDYKAPDSVTAGEHVSSPHRTAFVHKYVRAVLDAFAPFMIDIVAIRDPKKYASLVPETFDYKAHPDHSAAEEVSRGLFEIRCGVGKGYSTAELQFYADVPNIGPTQISINVDRDFSVHQLYPRGIRRGQGDDSLIRRWDIPQNSGACHLFRRGGADQRGVEGAIVPQSYAVEYLFDTREAMEAAIGLTA